MAGRVSGAGRFFLALVLGLVVALGGIGIGGAATSRVILVCNGSIRPCPPGGPFVHTIQGAVDLARPGDWVLIWPGVYHEAATRNAGVWITTPDIHLRGLDRNGVVVDGARLGAASVCSPNLADQVFAAGGRNGIEIYKVDGVTVDNLTVCNYLADRTGAGGNEIWWNGGFGSGVIGMGSYAGSYLSATSTFYQSSLSRMAQYGIFASNASGPGSLSYSYASNMGDSGIYVGACADCNAILDHLRAENNAVGYSGTNSGGRLLIQNSEWDQNKTGLVPDSLNHDDTPSPQDGRCPNGAVGPLGTGSCTIIRDNFIHDNNNPNVPAFSLAGLAPVGAGIEISGGGYDTILNNRIEHQGAWGVLIHDYPDLAPPVAPCLGGIPLNRVCYFIARGNQVVGNNLAFNGFFGNPTNGDLANQAAARPRNCFVDNYDPLGLTSDPANLQAPSVDGPPCAAKGVGDDTALRAQIFCAAGLLTCPPGSSYPRATRVQLLPLTPRPTMPDPCAGVPTNPWCPSL